MRKALTGTPRSQWDWRDVPAKTGAMAYPSVGTVLVEHDIPEKLAAIETLRTWLIWTTVEKMVETGWAPKKATEGAVTSIEMAVHSDRADVARGESLQSYLSSRDLSN